MGLSLTINSVLRSDHYSSLEVGQIYNFEKTACSSFFTNTPLWLAHNDWTARAEISIISQTLAGNTLTGQFRVDYIYRDDEQEAVTALFIRMYAGISENYIYLLSSKEEYQQAQQNGQLVRDSLAEEGFIHGAPKHQLTRIANKYYTQTPEPLVMVVDKSLVTNEIKWEPATGGLYPHIYGPLNMNAVVRTVPVALSETGCFDIKNI
ncbi:DUF952 domain-containing protein [Thalassomonas viridans]|uniref:DUF952 domain-containing protein n=1 Tax=Thalassomonas viridans TaxID=137584 RepID=A0AAE9Z2K5_9GAMM|nr:DUF952 domain-containing protein [Thalassomonas viridans]WDE04073.1 DUF952 domain-containing protein [Thalassomonas viridans]